MTFPHLHQADRGSALLELVFVLPFLCALLFGTIELGQAWVSKNRVEGSVVQAARFGATDGARPEADRDLLVALQASLPAPLLADVDRVVVFRATDPTGTVPAGCIKALGDPSEVGTSLCNTYNGATLRSVTAASMAGFGGTAGKKDAYWAPASRLDTLDGPPDYVGVWVRTKNRPLTSFAFTKVAITATSVTRIQPDLTG